MTHRTWRQGLTLVELVAVIAVLATLSALLLTTVQQVRESTRCLQCKHQVQQLALAVHQFHDIHGRLPAAMYSPAEKNGWAWGAMILPYIDQEHLFGELDVAHRSLQQAANDPTTFLRLQTLIPLYQCPSDEDPTPLNTERPYPRLIPQQTVYLRRSNYKACIGGNSTTGGAFVIADERPTSFSGFTDGLSNTFLIGEAMSGMPRGTDVSQCSAVWAGGEVFQSTSAHGNVALDTQLAVSGSCMFRLQTGEWDGGPGEDEPSAGFGSRHPLGANLAMCDGSVRFINEAIDWSAEEDSSRAYNALGTRSGGELLAEF